jgi:Mob1/phocein family
MILASRVPKVILVSSEHQSTLRAHSLIRLLLKTDLIVPDTPFPDSFLSTAKQIFTRLFRVYAIVYSEHLGVIEDMGAIAHLNTSLTHLLYFCWELDLLRHEEEDAIKCVVESIKQQYLGTGACPDVGRDEIGQG